MKYIIFVFIDYKLLSAKYREIGEILDCEKFIKLFHCCPRSTDNRESIGSINPVSQRIPFTNQSPDGWLAGLTLAKPF